MGFCNAWPQSPALPIQSPGGPSLPGTDRRWPYALQAPRWSEHRPPYT